MNPWAFVIIAIGILLIIIGVKGTQHDIASAVTGGHARHRTVNQTGQAV
jgi:hypothetical protein